ncbi:MAG: histidyl-tRNA synthetase, partial [Microgenomates group bacterium LiPW_16]
EEARLRESVITTLKEVFSLYGFSPLETPALEYAETLLSKYGKEADKLIYQFRDRGGREVGLRYDLTVPLARVIASYPTLPMPFKRYQIQPVWRAEKPQAGRYREFLQCDADIVGTGSPIADAEIIAMAVTALKNLGFTDFKILVNDRNLFADLPMETIIILDKLDKIGKDGVIAELVKKGYSQEKGKSLLSKIQTAKTTPSLEKIFSYLVKLGIEEKFYKFNPTLARGLEYYTGTIFEAQIAGYPGGSVAGGGRFDKLIGMFIGKDIPAVGISFGIDRVIEALRQTGTLLETKGASSAEVLVTVFDAKTLSYSLSIANRLRNAEISTEVYPDEETKLDKQLKYADKKGIEWVVIVGPDEIKDKTITVKNMQTGEQKRVKETSLIKYLPDV